MDKGFIEVAMDEKTIEMLESVFTERKKAVIRGRQEGPRRPERSTKAGYKGRGYSGKGGAMKGRDDGTELPVPPLPGESKPVITEFDNTDDWILSMILVAVMHANPDISAKEAIKIGKEWVKKLHMPRSSHMWTRQTSRINRYGIRAEASKIRREMFKLI